MANWEGNLQQRQQLQSVNYVAKKCRVFGGFKVAIMCTKTDRFLGGWR
jgi:hypothetical protein